MEESTKKLLNETEMKEKLLKIYESEGLYKKISKEYGISRLAIADLKDMTNKEFEDFLKEIPYIKLNLQEGKSNQKISAKLGCGAAIIYFIKKELIGVEKNRGKSVDEEYLVLRKKIESLWKKSKLGEQIVNIAGAYQLEANYAVGLVENFNTMIEKKRRRLENLKDNDIKRKEIEGLKETWNFDDDTIAYIAEGKEFEKEKDEGVESLDEP